MTGLSEDDYLLKQGRIAFKEGDVQKAIQFFEQVLALNANNVEAIQLLGTANHSLGNYNLAIEKLEHSLQFEDSNVQVWSILAQSYEMIREYKKSVYAFKKILELDPEHPNREMIISKIDNLVLKTDFSK